MLRLRKPYLLYLGDAQMPTDAKTACGLRDWCPADVIGEWSLPSGALSVGVPRRSPEEAAALGAGSLVIGIASVGGTLPPQWLPDLHRAIDAGLDIVSGMHTRLTSFPELLEAASARGVSLQDVRHSDRRFPAGTGRKRSGLRVATVGTDCALGKKYTALALTRELATLGANATFRATGQTGIMIAGEGIAIDAVVADFIAGAAEVLSPANDPHHWDVIEGQGSLFNPAYAAVSLGLLHGSQPDVFVVCHDPSRAMMLGLDGYALPSVEEVIDLTIRLGKRTNPAIRCAGISLNTAMLEPAEAADLLASDAARLGLPVADPIRGGAPFAALVDACLA
jgi:uncharacterized NAD-dependent epimerase/dehydratase family protein